MYHGGDEKCVQYIMVKSLYGRDHLEDLSMYTWEYNIKVEFLRKYNGRVWSGYIWLRITSGG
jgi:hypothetical protein